MPKNDIHWKRPREDGSRCEVKAQLTNNQWAFRIRGGRFESWELHREPPLQDWLELHANLESRVARGLYRPKVLQRLQNAINERFPNARLS